MKGVLNKKTLLEAGLIILIAAAAGIIFNLSHPNKLPFIGEEKVIDYSQSDSLLTALRIQDSLEQISTYTKDSLRLIKEQQVKDGFTSQPDNGTPTQLSMVSEPPNGNVRLKLAIFVVSS